MKMGRKSCIFSAGGVATLHEGFIHLLVPPQGDAVEGYVKST
jgi:hypothetical protein